MRKELSALDKALYFLDRKVSKACREFDLIATNDRILVALSGGKDSLTLLRVLARRRQWSREKYEVFACHVKNPLSEGIPRLEDFCREIDVPLLLVDGTAPPLEGSRKTLSPCFLCARSRRKALFRTAEELRCNKVAFGHHKDDLAQTLLMNLLLHGKHETMLPKQPMFETLSIIRPLALVDEKAIERVSRIGEFPVQACRCTFAPHSKRTFAKDLLRSAREAGIREATDNLLKSVFF